MRVRTAARPLLHPLSLVSSPPPPYRSRGGGGKTREPEQGLSQCAGGPRARPPPSLPRGPIRIYYNVVASRGGGARAGRGPRRPLLGEERREGARQGCLLALSLARSLARSLPPSACGFSQPACSRRATEGRSLGRRRRLLPLFVRLKLLLARPGATGEARRAREGARGEPVGGAALAPRGRSGRPRSRRSLCLQPPLQAREPGCGLTRRAGGLEAGTRPGEPVGGGRRRPGRSCGKRGEWGAHRASRLKVQPGVSSRGGVPGPCRPVSHRAVGGSPGRKPGGQWCEGAGAAGDGEAGQTTQAASEGAGRFAALPGLPESPRISEPAGSGALLRDLLGSQRAKG